MFSMKGSSVVSVGEMVSSVTKINRIYEGVEVETRKCQASFGII